MSQGFKGGHPYQGSAPKGDGCAVDTYSAGKGGLRPSGAKVPDPHPMGSTSGDKSTPGDLGFSTGALHSYMGHFGKDEVIRKGHNVSRPTSVVGAKKGTNVGPGADFSPLTSGTPKVSNDGNMAPRPNVVTPNEPSQPALKGRTVMATQGGSAVVNNAKTGNTYVKPIAKLARKTAAKAIRAGNAAVAAAKPKLAARIAKRQARRSDAVSSIKDKVSGVKPL